MDFSRLSDQQVAQMILVDEGATPGDAALALLNDPEAVGRLEDKIAAKRAALAQTVVDAERQAFEASPEGRRRAALAHAAQADERARLVAAARTMLEAEGYGDVSDLSDERVLHHAGIERQASLMSLTEKDAAHVELAERVAGGHIRDDETLIREAEAVGADPRSIVRHATGLLGGGETE
jgi:hypothetical protein